MRVLAYSGENRDKQQREFLEKRHQQREREEEVQEPPGQVT